MVHKTNHPLFIEFAGKKITEMKLDEIEIN
jgi:hypothetical protein